MTTPPTPKSVSGPICKICKKPTKDHSFQQQQECLRKAKERGVSIW